MFIILSAAKQIRQHESDIPLEIRSDNCDVSVMPYRSEKGSIMKVFFVVKDARFYADGKERLPDFTTDDEKSVFERMLLVINR